LAILATLIAVFYTEEDWRGKRAWENYKRELEAKGLVLDWSKFIPPPVPDDQNFFKAPKMTDWFVKGQNGTELSKPLQNSKTFLTNLTVAAANDYLAWSGQFQPQFDQIREALKRPYARMDGDYSRPYEIPIANFITLRALVQVLEKRAKCYLVLGQPGRALDELTLLNDSRRIAERGPAGKPITLVDAMISVAVTALYVDTVADGLQKRIWQEEQLTALKTQLEQINLPSIVVQSFNSEPAATTHTLETIPPAKLKEWFSPGGKMSRAQRLENLKWTLMPRGWIYQNMATSARLVFQQTEGCDPANDIIQPKRFGDLSRELKTIAKPYRFIAAEAIPNFTKAWQTTAHNQTMVDEAQIACALERFRLAHGVYPDTLDTLAPQFIATIPHDIIGGEPLHYRRTEDGKFLLYSIGWNERDDGGKDSPSNPNGGIDYTKGDWVWKN
jgi:hypothetical protein